MTVNSARVLICFIDPYASRSRRQVARLASPGGPSRRLADTEPHIEIHSAACLLSGPRHFSRTGLWITSGPYTCFNLVQNLNRFEARTTLSTDALNEYSQPQKVLDNVWGLAVWGQNSLCSFSSPGKPPGSWAFLWTVSVIIAYLKSCKTLAKYNNFCLGSAQSCGFSFLFNWANKLSFSLRPLAVYH